MQINLKDKVNINEWKDYTFDKKLEVCQIPEDILKKISTDDLIEAVLSHPMLTIIYVYQSLQKGFDVLFNNFNGLSELMQRKDAGNKLFGKYNIINTSNNNLDIFSLAFIEVMLGQYHILRQFNNEQLLELKKVINKKHGEKRENQQVYGLTSAAFYDVLVENQSSMKLMNMDSRRVLGAQVDLYTPKGTKVKAYKDSEKITKKEIEEINKRTLISFPSVKIISNPDPNYNCHSYAWYSQSTTNPYWIDDPRPYMTDGSYIFKGIDSGAVGQKVYYDKSGYEHSGIVCSRNPGPLIPNHYNAVTVYSKWGSWGLIQHKAQDCPYYFQNLKLKFYEKSK